MTTPVAYLDVVEHLEKLVNETVVRHYTPAEGLVGNSRMLADRFDVESGRQYAIQKVDDLLKILEVGSPCDTRYPEIKQRVDSLHVYLKQMRKEILNKDL